MIKLKNSRPSAMDYRTKTAKESLIYASKPTASPMRSNRHHSVGVFKKLRRMMKKVRRIWI